VLNSFLVIDMSRCTYLLITQRRR